MAILECCFYQTDAGSTIKTTIMTDNILRRTLVRNISRKLSKSSRTPLVNLSASEVDGLNSGLMHSTKGIVMDNLNNIPEPSDLLKRSSDKINI